MNATQTSSEHQSTDVRKKTKKKRSNFALWLDEQRCKRTVNRWKSRQKKQEKRKAMAVKIMRLPHASLIGDSLYMIGFWAEYLIVCALRAIVKIVVALTTNIEQVVVLILRPFLAGLVLLLNDITQPFAQMRSEVQQIGSIADGEEDESVAARKKRKAFRLRRAKLYMALARNIGAYLLPTLAAIALIFTIQLWQGYHYVLNVQVNGQSVGYVESEQVFESAREDVQSRINNAKLAMKSAGFEVNDTQWEISPTYTLAVSGETMTESDVTDAILRASSDEISDGTAVYIDGALSYVTTEGDHLRTYLETIQAPYVKQSYSDEAYRNARVEFAHDIELADGVYFTSSIANYGDIINALSESSYSYYTATAEDTLETVLTAVGLSLGDFQALNPEVTDENYTVTEGQTFVSAKQSAPLLQVQTIVRDSKEEEVGFSTQEIETDAYDFGKTVTEQEGVPGLQEVTFDLVYINGQLTDTKTVSVTQTQAPVDEIVYRGTKLKSGMVASTGSGTFMWPVPQYNYVSRWMGNGHNGADICASYGTPIIASDGGVVETAGYHYSYGNYVVINHGNGYRTLYAHMSQILVSAGQAVSQGQQIGCVGSTGNSTGNHCHFEMYYNGVRFSAYQLFAGM